MTATPAPSKPRGNLVPDLIAGLTTGVANIPDAMASAILAGVNPLQGLYAVMIGTPLGALFSSSAFMNIAATSALAITAGSAVAGYSEDARASAITTLALLTGLVMLLAGLLKMGRLLRFVSNSVVIGFLTGVSINVILSQLGDFTGYASEYSNKVVKAVDTLLRATAAVPNAHLWLIGEGPERAKLETLARELGIAERVRLPGWQDDVLPAIRAADVYLVPSRHEPLGSVVLEGWMARRPMVAAASQGPAWLIQEGETGLLVPIDAPQAMAAAVRRILDDPQMAERLAQQGRAAFEKDFTEAAAVRHYLGLFRRLIEQAREQRR